MGQFTPDATDDNRSREASFGIGCFHFSATSEESVADHDYYDKIRTILEAIPHVTNIDVVPTTSSRFSGSTVPPNERSLNTQDGINPWPTNGYISFDLLIPARFQNTYRGGWRSPLKSESFAVRIVFNEGFPVAFVRSLGPDLEENPSTMVMIVREHLANTLKDDEEIRFTYLGPSPFHGDFFVSSSKAVDSLDVLYSPQSGYDEIELVLPSELKVSDALPALEWRLAEELGFFYEKIQETNQISSEVLDLMSESEELSDTHSKPASPIRFLKQLFPRTHAAHLRIATEKAEIRIAEFERSWVKKKSEIESKFGSSLIEVKMSAEVEGMKEYPITSYRRIAEAIDSRLSGASTNRSVFVAAVVSGIVSVAVTLALNQFAPPHAAIEAAPSASLPASSDADPTGQLTNSDP